MSVVWIWIAWASVGTLGFGVMAYEAWLDFQEGRRSKQARLVLTARMGWYMGLSWFVAYAAFTAAGVASLLRARGFVAPILVAGVAQATAVVTLVVWRDRRRLYRLIEADIRQRTKGD